MKNGQLETNDLFQIIGQKEAENYVLRVQIQELQQQCQELKDQTIKDNTDGK